MANYYGPPAPSSMPASSPVKVWTAALQPSEANFVQIARDPNASAGRAYAWVAIAGAIGALLSAIIGFVINAAWGAINSGGDTNALAGVFGLTAFSGVWGVVCGVPLAAIGAVIGLTIVAGIPHLLALALGGRGTFTQMLYAVAAYVTPLTVINSVLGAIPFIGLLVGLIGIYMIVLNITAVKAVHELSWGKALIASLVVPFILFALIFACVAFVVLVVLGPAIGTVFSNIVINI